MHKIFELASAGSLWRGVDYYKKRKVISYSKDGLLYTGLVKGRSSDYTPFRSEQLDDAPIYHVTVNPEKPRSSTCDGPFAKDRHVVCKHMVALFIEAEPEQLDMLYKEIKECAEQEQEEEQRERISRREELEREARAMSRIELERAYVEKRLDECVEELREERW